MKRASLVLALLVCAALLAGCGSGGGDSTAEATAPTVSAKDAARQRREAEAICTRLVGDAHSFARHAFDELSKYPNTLEFTTEALIAPALPVVERSARELREVRGEAADPQLSAYVAMFDPILSLLEERVRAGRRGDGNEAHQIEDQLIEFGAIQENLAREAGLKICAVSLVGAFAKSAG
jgi:hypothetical protein